MGVHPKVLGMWAGFIYLFDCACMDQLTLTECIASFKLSVEFPHHALVSASMPTAPSFSHLCHPHPLVLLSGIACFLLPPHLPLLHGPHLN